MADEKKVLENINAQLELINAVIGLLVLHKIIDSEELSKLSPFGYDATKKRLEDMKNFIDALLKSDLKKA